MTRRTILGQVAEVFNGKTPNKNEQRSAGHPVLKIRDIGEDGSFRGPFESFVDTAFVNQFRQKLVHSGDTLILNAAHNASYVGSKIALAPPEAIGALATGEWLIVRPAHANPHLVYHWLRFAAATSALRDLVKGIHLYPKDVANLQFPELAMAEQDKIANVLNVADEIRRKCQEAIALTEQLLRSTFLEMFGDLKSGTDWTSVEFLAEERAGSIRTGPFGSQLLHSEFTDSGVAVLGIDNAVENEFRWGRPRFISEEKYNALRRYTVRPRDIIITIMGTCGRCAIIPDDIPTAINTKHLCCITLDKTKCLPEFLHSYFLFHPTAQSYLSRSAKGAIMDGLNMGIITQLPVPVVPLALQSRYQRSVAAVSALKRRLLTYAVEADNLFNSLVQRAFTGQL